MAHEESIGALRSRVAELVEQEGVLLTQAFDLSREGKDRQGVEALFARVQAMQVERNSLKKRIGSILGTHRLHEASEVWRVGVYDYRQEVGGEVVRVRVTQGPLGLQVLAPGERTPVRIEGLEGTFDGPLALDDAASPAEVADAQAGPQSGSSEAARAGHARGRKRTAGKKND